MRTRAHLTRVGINARNLGALWSSLKSFLEVVGSDHRPAAAQRATGRRRWRVNFAPGRLVAGRTAASRRETSRLNVALIDGSNTVRPTAERHLLIALLSTEYRRGVFWETVGFLAAWLSGLISLAVCWL